MELKDILNQISNSGAQAVVVVICDSGEDKQEPDADDLMNPLSSLPFVELNSLDPNQPPPGA